MSRAQHIAQLEDAVALETKTAQQNGASKRRRYRRTLKKLAIAAVLSAGEEFVASWLAKDRGKHGHYFTQRIPKHAIFGSLIYIPLNHWLLKATQSLFRSHKGAAARFFSILFGLLVVAPVQKIIFFAAVALIAGARTQFQVRATIRAGLRPVMRVLLLAYPVAVAVAWNFLPQNAWLPFFGVVNWAVNIYGLQDNKKKRIEAVRRRYLANRAMDERKLDDSADKQEQQGESSSASESEDEKHAVRKVRHSNLPRYSPSLRQESPNRLHRHRRKERDSTDSDMEHYSPALGARTKGAAARSLYMKSDTGSWLDSKDSSSAVESPDERMGSEIDSDTSSEFPIRLSKLHKNKLS